MKWPWYRTKDISVAMSYIWDASLYFRVFHSQFDSKRAYRALIVEDFGPAASAVIYFVNEKGYLWAVKQSKCICVNQHTSRMLLPTESQFELPAIKPKSDWE